MKHRARPALVALLLAAQLGAVPALSRQVRFHTLGLAEGLSHSYVTSIASDRQGFLWFGTQDGLDRFDGYGIRAFRHDPADPRSLSNNFVTDLLVDRAGTLWVGTFGAGLARFDRRSETFQIYRHDPKRPGTLASDQVMTLLEDRQGTLWVGGDSGGLARFDPRTGTFLTYRNEPDDPATIGYDDIWDIAEDHDGNFWIATFGGGVDRFDPRRRVFTHYPHDPQDPTSLSHDEVQTIYVDSRGRVWIGTYGGGLNLYDPARNGFRHFRHDSADPTSLGDDVVFALLEDKRGHFWVGTETAGLNLMDREAGTFQPFRHDPYSPGSLSHDSVECLYEDPSGTVWAGTYNGGVSYFHDQKFEHVTAKPGGGGLVNSVVTSLLEDRKGRLWVGTDGGGITRFDRKKGEVKIFRNDPADPRSLGNDAVQALSEDRAGRIWVGTYAGGLELFEPGGETFRHFRHDPNDPTSISRDDVRAIWETSRGDFWVATSLGGLDRMDRDAGTFVTYRHDDQDPTSLSDDQALSLYEDRAGTLWVGTGNGGLNRFDPTSGRFDRFGHRPGDTKSLADNRVLAMFEDARGRLWVGTAGGLDLFDRASGTFTHFTIRDGLPNDVVNAILEDAARGHLWLSTNRGLSRFDPERRTFRNYDALDGLQGSQFIPRAALRGRGGELYFGGLDGFNVFDPGTLRDNTFVPPVVLTELTLDNRPVPISRDGPLREAISEARSLVLSHRDAVIGFGFAALSYVAAPKNRYAFKLEGFDERWQQVGTRRTATYTNLDPGRYVFRVRASNNDGVWNTRGTALSLIVTPPFWQTWWFRAGALLLVAVAAGSAYQGRVRAMQRRNVELEARVRNRTLQLEAANQELEAFAFSVSHDLRAPLRHIAGFSQMLREDYLEAIDERGRDYLARIAAAARHMGDLIDGLLGLSRVTRGEMRVERVDLSAVAARVAAALRETYPRAEISIAPHLVAHGDERLLELALDNLLDNACKFSAKVSSPRVEVGVVSAAELPGEPTNPHPERVFFVRDNGAGFDMEHADRLFGAFQRLHLATEFEGTGIGLATVQRIVRRHGGRIWAEAAVGRGATFYFTLE